MKITIELPEKNEDIVALGKALIKSKIDISLKESYIFLIANLSKNKPLRTAIETYNNDQSRVHKQIKKCVFKKYFEHIFSQERVNFQSCAYALLDQMYRYSNKEPYGIFVKALKFADSYASVFRIKRSRFYKNSMVLALMQKFPNVNPRALEYMHMQGKLNLIKDDFIVFETFLANMLIKNDESLRKDKDYA